MMTFHYQEWQVHKAGGLTGLSFNLQPVPGYVRWVTLDCQPNQISFVGLRDAFGTSILVGDGDDILRRVPLYGEQLEEPREGVVPLEFGPRLGCISGASAALQMHVDLSFREPDNQAVVTCGVEFYPLSYEMVGLGSTCQWIAQTASRQADSTRWWLPHMGGYIPHFFLRPVDDIGDPAGVGIAGVRCDDVPVPWEITEPEPGLFKVSSGGISNPQPTNPGTLIEVDLSGDAAYLRVLAAQWIPAGVLIPWPHKDAEYLRVLPAQWPQ